MDVADDQKMQVMISSNNNTQLIDDDKEEEALVLPGFRFHPTDQELVGFYLRRKVDNKLLNINFDLIKQIDIYKYDPWDLPWFDFIYIYNVVYICRCGQRFGEKQKQEWYFFCRRGRKYRNSIRPNRVTGSGFWKATGIDRPIYNSISQIIGLKKSLVYYRGSAGKGTKTEWMMHEFRLPLNPSPRIDINNIDDDKTLSQQAEVWTLCRILKRSTSVSHRKSMPDWRELSAKRNMNVVDTGSKTCSTDSDHDHQDKQSYISFELPIKNPFMSHNHHHNTDHISITTASYEAASASCSSSFSDLNDFIKHGDWDGLRSVVEYHYKKKDI
ncbi:hypothetical protein OSB04_003775 [Centaurea solstitialis]|uniref:NAC domain-containing protein n=1 Tax=Centaurea solstitialis TaxID=347529 RepID=A0AA38TVT0_9ASTR|nr:hypothetical protein OSB04_003775 [Centaurea solstitialis]